MYHHNPKMAHLSKYVLVYKYPKTVDFFLENSTFIQQCTGSKWTKFLWNYFPCSHKNPPIIIIGTSGIIRHMICSRPRAPLTQISGRKERGKMFLTHRAFELKVTTWHFYRYLSHFGPPKNRHSLDNKYWVYLLFSWNPDQFHLRTTLCLRPYKKGQLPLHVYSINNSFKIIWSHLSHEATKLAIL